MSPAGSQVRSSPAPRWPHAWGQSSLASQYTCVTPCGHYCGHQAASATCMSSCEPLAPCRGPGPSPLLPCPQCGPNSNWACWALALSAHSTGPSEPCPGLRGPCRFPTIPWFFPTPAEVHTAWSVLPWERRSAQQTLWPPHRTARGLGAAACSEGNGPSLHRARVPHMRRCSTGVP